MPNSPFRQIRVMGKNDKTYDAIINIDNIVHVLPDGLTCVLSMTDGSTLRSGQTAESLMDILDQGVSKGRRESIAAKFIKIMADWEGVDANTAAPLAYELVEAI